MPLQYLDENSLEKRWSILLHFIIPQFHSHSALDGWSRPRLIHRPFLHMRVYCFPRSTGFHLCELQLASLKNGINLATEHPEASIFHNPQLIIHSISR